MRKILLIEPKYQNKYPPIGLMKISTYHKALGDEVKFYKGDVKDLIVDSLTDEAIEKIQKYQNCVIDQITYNNLRSFIKLGRKDLLNIPFVTDSDYSTLVNTILQNYSQIFRKKRYDAFPKWDRVYVSTLFTFYWKVTIEVINQAKHLIDDLNEIKVGGVMASLLSGEIQKATGIKPIQGLLDKPGMLDPGNAVASTMIIDDLPLDYSILDEIDYEYPTGSAYFTFMTKGCTRKCAFCSVPKLEPTYKPKIPTIDKFNEIKMLYGEQQNLLLMDNNVLASPFFEEIIQEIKSMGFYKGAKMVEPNQLDIAVKNLKAGNNELANIRRSRKLFNRLLPKLKLDKRDVFYQILHRHRVLEYFKGTTKENIIAAYDELKDMYEKHRNKSWKMRYVDFNQGTDARYVTEEKMKLLSEIPIKPLRIAFDYWGIKDQYENAVRLAAKYGIDELSNYILYNFNDTPDELYKRLEINVALGEELGIHIYSFPMKFIPLFGEDAKDRNYIGPKWNKKYIRAIQSILNVTKGIVAPGRDFFEKAFGKNLVEFHNILMMPETFIVYRYYFEGEGYTSKWRDAFNSLSEEQKQIASAIICKNDFNNLQNHQVPDKIKYLLQFYKIKREDVDTKGKDEEETKRIQKNTYKLLKEDRFKYLTITPEYEKGFEQKTA